MLTNCLKIALLLLPSFAFSQAVNTDSLRRQLKKDLPDSVRYVVSDQLAFYYRAVNLDSALYYNELSIELARKQGQKLDEGYSIDEKGYVLYMQNKLAEALHTLLEAKVIADDPASNQRPWFSRAGRM